MKILFVHQNFPAQYKHVAPYLRKQGHHVVALSLNDHLLDQGILSYKYTLTRNRTPGIHPLLAETETKVIRGESVARVAANLREQGFYPDIICAHPGWGEALFLKEIWPKAPILGFFEFYYHSTGADVNFDPEFPSSSDVSEKIILKNTTNLLSLTLCDHGVTPTNWQKRLHPSEFHSKLSVIHDGIDTNIAKPDRDARYAINNHLTLTANDKVVTFVNRSLEPYRGWHIFARAIPAIQKKNPDAHVVIVGGDDVSYGKRPENGISYKEQYWDEIKHIVDSKRIHFLGRIPYDRFISLMQLSSVHVYLTYPFVLSWSMLEAMSCGALVVGSKTPPVSEIIEHNRNGLLVDFFDSDGIADSITHVLENDSRYIKIREAARAAMLDQYDLNSICLPRHVQLIQSAASRGYR